MQIGQQRIECFRALLKPLRNGLPFRRRDHQRKNIEIAASGLFIEIGKRVVGDAIFVKQTLCLLPSTGKFAFRRAIPDFAQRLPGGTSLVLSVDDFVVMRMRRHVAGPGKSLDFGRHLKWRSAVRGTGFQGRYRASW